MIPGGATNGGRRRRSSSRLRARVVGAGVAGALIAAACGNAGEAARTTALVPKPNSMTVGSGSVDLDSQTMLIVESGGGAVDPVVTYIQESIKAATGWDWRAASGQDMTASGSVVRLSLSERDVGGLGSEAYRLRAGNGEIAIEASKPAGLFYGFQTLRQLLPPEVYGNRGSTESSTLSVPEVSIDDEPDLEYRGVMLDVARHFFTPNEVKALIDVMAAHKLNRLHMHLTDDEGWRLEIKKYPEFTNVGAWRGGGTALPPLELDTAGFPLENGKPTAGRPIAPMGGNSRYGGFYTQDDIRELVAYAQDRFIEIIPEIEGPAHNRAAVVSYPELLSDPEDFSDYTSVQGYTDNVLAAELPSTYTVMEDVLSEVIELFPSEFVHIGGDEVPAQVWTDCAPCQAVADEQGLSSVKELRSLYLSRLYTFLASKDKQAVVWETFDLLDPQVEPYLVDAWANGAAGVDSADAGNPTIFTPAQFAYMDQRYSLAYPEIGLEWAGTTDSARAYSYQIPLDQMRPEGRDNALGISIGVFTELIWNQERLDEMMFPRATALAEVAWTKPELRSWPDFAARMGSAQLDRLDAMGIGYRIAPPEWESDGSTLSLSAEFPGQTIRYVWGATDPTTSSSQYTAPLTIGSQKMLRAAVFDSSDRRSDIAAVDVNALVGSGAR